MFDLNVISEYKEYDVDVIKAKIEPAFKNSQLELNHNQTAVAAILVNELKKE